MRLACERAADAYGGDDGMFNAAGFSLYFKLLAGMSNGIDGEYVRAILSGRSDIRKTGGGHYQIIRRSLLWRLLRAFRSQTAH